MPKPLRTILDPKKPWPMGLLFRTVCCLCLVFWAMDLLARDLPCPRPPCVLCCVFWCGASVRCVFKIFVGASKIWALPLTPLLPDPLPRPPPPPPSAGPPPPDRPKFRSLFFPLPSQFSFFLPLLGVVSLNFGGVIEGRPQMCTFGLSRCRVKPGGLSSHPSGPHLGPTLRGPCTLRTSTLRAPPFGAPPFWTPAFGAPPRDPPSAGPPKISPFFASPPFSLFLSLSLGSSRGIWVGFEASVPTVHVSSSRAVV